MIRLCSVIGENDTLLKKYLNHYTELGVEFFHFIVHDPTKEKCLWKRISSRLEKCCNVELQLYTGRWNGVLSANQLNNVIHKHPSV